MKRLQSYDFRNEIDQVRIERATFLARWLFSGTLTARLTKTQVMLSDNRYLCRTTFKHDLRGPYVLPPPRCKASAYAVRLRVRGVGRYAA